MKGPIPEKAIAEEAIKPSFIRDIYKAPAEEASKIDDNPSESEQLMLRLSQSDEWKHLKGYMNRVIKRLLDMTREASRQKLDAEETGMRFFIYDQLEAFSSDIISHVERPAKSKIIADQIKKQNEQE